MGLTVYMGRVLIDCKIDAKSIHFKQVIAECMEIPEELIPKEEEE